MQLLEHAMLLVLAIFTKKQPAWRSAADMCSRIDVECAGVVVNTGVSSTDFLRAEVLCSQDQWREPERRRASKRVPPDFMACGRVGNHTDASAEMEQ